MLTEISDNYNEKIDDLKKIASKQSDTHEDKDEAQEIKQALKSENKELKDKIEWLNKDIEFKTLKLNEFLNDSSQKLTEIS